MATVIEATANGMTFMGSEAQVAWACDIYAELAPALEHAAGAFRRSTDAQVAKLPESLRPVMAPMMNAKSDAHEATVRAFITSHSEAAWWIEQGRKVNESGLADRAQAVTIIAAAIVDAATK